MARHQWTARSLLLGATALAGALALSAGSAAAQQQEFSFDLPAQPLDVALRTYARTAEQQVIFAGRDVLGRKSAPVSGRYSAEEALQIMLAGSDLTVQRTAEGVLQVARAAQGPQGGSADDGDAVEALIVTAQKREEQIQDVPIAISAFTQKSLDAQKLEGGFDLLKAIPNVSFSKSNFSGYNFSIRGIGTKAVSATTDPGVAVSFNNTTLIVNRLFEQEYFDVERVEVLRGPQGTLYGRNATGGVINVLSARPRLGEFEADAKLEAGNYNAKRARGMINVPIGDTIAIRWAGAITQRDGYGTNEAANDPNVANDVREDVDGRDLWSSRLTVGWEPTEAIRVNALWERFEEDDNRVRTSKQLCHHDAGPATIGGADATVLPPISRAITSQGCLPGSLYDDGAFGTPNGASLPYVSGLFYGSSFGALSIAGYNFSGLGGNPYYSDFFGSTPLEEPCPGQSGAGSSIYFPLNLCTPDPYGGRTQSRDLRTIHSAIEPTYRAKADIFELSIDIDVSDSVTFTSQTVFATDEYYASQDYNRYTTSAIFNDSSIACDWRDMFPPFNFYGSDCTSGTPYAGGFYNVTPRPEGSPLGTPGVFNDPQLGPSSSLLAQDLSQVESEQFNQEFRLASNFDAPFNFSLGANFTRFETMNDYYAFLNAATLLTHFFPFNTHRNTTAGGCDGPAQGEPNPWECVYVDPNPLESINGEGHNYFRSANPYELTSSALFGELYWQATDTLKVTLGARMSWDRKVFTPIPSQLLLHDYRYARTVSEGEGPEACTNLEQCQLAGTATRGSPADPEIRQAWREPTGRLIVDWKPDLGFTDETMVYASIAHGYKGGGANPPSIAGPAGILAAKASAGTAPKTFDPEFVDALEIGTKNTLLGGALVLNGSAFYYDYAGYQVSKILDRSALNENFDTTVWGLELEWIWSPLRNLRFNGTVGHLQTEIAEGERSIDLMDRTQGGHHSSYIDVNGVEHALAFDEWVVLKPWVSASSNCVAPAELVAAQISGGAGIDGLCPAGNVLGFHPFADYRALEDAPNGGQGFFAELAGKELPNAPHWTVSLGGQYRFELPGGWDATLRSDFYWQDKSFARVYNTEYDRLKAWTNTNISLWVENPEWGVTAEVYVKNAFDETPITDAFLNSDDSGLTTNIFTLDPRLVGVSVRKQF